MQSELTKKGKGITEVDEQILDLGINNGDRARFLYQKLYDINNPEERAAKWIEWQQKQIITPKVQQQLIFLLQHAQQARQQ